MPSTANTICQPAPFVCQKLPAGLQTKAFVLQIKTAFQPRSLYLSDMTRSQRYISYAAVIFLMVWGLDLINAIKFNLPITWEDVFSPLRFSQTAYCLGTFILCRALFRRIIPRRRYLLILPAILLLILFFTIFRYMLEEVLYPVLFQMSNYRAGTSLFYYTLDNIYFAFVYITLGILLYLVDAYIQQQKDQSELLKRNREAELQFLRTQINPHFLFNTLNNIYSLVYDKSPEAPGAVLQLSELMRYLLYEKNERVPLKKEWDYIQHFIALQQLRFEKPATIRQTTEGKWEDWPIAPYLLIPFFENAFKHGDFKTDPLEIKLVAGEKELNLTMRNRVSNRQKDQSGGIGLENVKKRLELIYPGKHTIYFAENEHIFEVAVNLTREKV